ncbi:DUF7224 domain-containing protein [Streptomyces sp. NEAU-Y11]|uniref:DUF7224 domain-containing protein n=1 Tax=Streptomyces cucumeris TaxID=2962890 RepID=UPI0020C91A56|nr:hypothetical protein [Streptomyces sp. NEAU-Y11]MCP9208758.1 hypothetical protein [Streptomyces sp. NEAU-Y11]
MRWKTLLRSGSALWATLLLVPALLFFSSGNTDSTIPYWESVTAQSTIVLGVVSAVCGACAAWESGRLKQAAISTWAPSRSDLRVACEHLAPVALLGVLGILAALVAFAGPARDTPGGPDWTVLAVSYTVVISHVAVGYLVGRWLPRLLGTALMLVFGYFWGFWPAALDRPAWLRHLNGQGIGDCCRLDQEPSLRSLGATALFSIGALAAVWIFLFVGSRRGFWILSSAVAVTGLVAAVVVAKPLGLDGEQARDRTALHCVGNQPQVCLWPEQLDHQADFVRWSHVAERRLRTAGLTPPGQMAFSQVVPDRETVLSVTATSLLPLDPPACALTPGAAYPGDEAVSVIYPWLAMTAGVRPDALQWPAEHVRYAEKVRELPRSSQRTWFDRNMRSVRDCSIKPELTLSAFTRATEKPT